MVNYVEMVPEGTFPPPPGPPPPKAKANWLQPPSQAGMPKVPPKVKATVTYHQVDGPKHAPAPKAKHPNCKAPPPGHEDDATLLPPLLPYYASDAQEFYMAPTTGALGAVPVIHASKYCTHFNNTRMENIRTMDGRPRPRRTSALTIKRMDWDGIPEA